MHCSQCGKSVEADWAFCPFCRNRLKAEPPRAAAQDPTFLKGLAAERGLFSQPLVAPARYRGHYADTLAVVIGVSGYRAQRLTYVQHDVRRFLAILSFLGVGQAKITTVTEDSASQAHLLQVFSTVLPARLKPGTRLIIFYAGAVGEMPHAGGYMEPVFMPHGSDPSHPSRGGIAASQLLQWFETMDLHHCEMIVDACSTGFWQLGGEWEALSHPLRDAMTEGAVEVLCAGRSDQRMYHLGEHSVFMEMLSRAVNGDAMPEGGEVMTGRDVGRYVCERVAATTAGGQTPAHRRIAGREDFLWLPHTERKERRSSVITAVGSGTLTVQSEPGGALVSVNGKARGETPLELIMAPGEYDIRVMLAGHQTWHRRCHFGGQPSRLRVRLRKAPETGLPSGLKALVSEFDRASRLPLRVTRTRDGAEMVLVPGGTFTLGSDRGAEDEGPAHEVALVTFYIDRYPVTNEMYEQYMRTCGAPRPALWRDHRYEHSHQPVVGVSWDEAGAYAAWAGATLPTEAQWESAARGGDDRMFPWGNTAPTGALARFAGTRKEEGPVPVDYFSGNVSPFGAQQMAGNVWEWCLDWYDAAYYLVSPNEEPKGPEFGRDRVVRGGAWDTKKGALRCTARGHQPPKHRGPDVGFRCVIVCEEKA
jgi:formylglycine-generating enzyme required for sulfatase activity